MRRERALAGLAAAALLTACHRTLPPQAAVSVPPVCHVGPDGGPGFADRGIGGTGGPAVADRGIGGTGAPTVADRGIGGTGIIGVITGFGSICLAGQEVALAADVPVLVNARPATATSLRAGQVAVVEATQNGGGLAARRVEVRYEVIGQTERLDGNQLLVAGQRIVVSPQTWGGRPRLGDWVAVSGLRKPDGVIAATRIEPITSGPILIHGMLQADVDPLGVTVFRVGDLPIKATPAIAAMVGRPVTVSGTMLHGRLLPFAIMPDLLVADPGAYFGPSIATVFVEGFATIEGDRLHLGPAFSAPTPGPRGFGPGRGVFRFERAAGGLRATVPAGMAPTSAIPHFDSAPVPNRTIPIPGRSSAPLGGGRSEGASGPFSRSGPTNPVRAGIGDNGPGGSFGGDRRQGAGR